MVVMVATFALLLSKRLRVDLVAILVILALSITKLLTPHEALSGFGSEPAIVVAAIFVLSGALEQTGVSDTIGRWIGRLAGNSYNRAIAVIMPAVAVLSAFTHHVTTTAIMLPVTLNFAKEHDISPSKLLMPLSFAASLGTTITIIGAPAFLVASAVLVQAGRPGLSIFSIAPIGLVLSLIGTAFIMVAGRFLLPDRASPGSLLGNFRLDSFFTELTIPEGSALIGKTIHELRTPDHDTFRVVGWVRNGKPLASPYTEYSLLSGDILRVHCSPEELMAFRAEAGIELQPVEKFGNGIIANVPSEEQELDQQLVQAVVAPNSDMIGRTIRSINFHERFGPIVVGLWRRAGSVRAELRRIRLRAGDVLLLMGDTAGIHRVAQDPAFLMMVPFEGESRSRRKARLAALIMLLTVLVAAVNLVTLEIATLAGATAVVLTGCLSGRQAYRAIDARIFVFIAGVIPLGAAMQKTGTAALLATALQQTIGGWPPLLILLAIFSIVAVLTQFLSDSATTALFAPIAVALATALGHAPEAYVVTVAMAAVTAFLTPMGHHGNLLIYGPGRYEFNDFIKVGGILTIIVAFVVTIMASLLWPG
jgi:di/tricarboxylate transporter